MRNLFILMLLGTLIGCNRKIVPSISLPSASNPCDKAIQAVLDSIQSVEPMFLYEVITEAGITDTLCIVDSASCNEIKLMALEVVSKYNTVIKERDYYKALSEQPRAKRIINNNYINSKNKNTQIGDQNVQQNKPKGPAINGNDNVVPIKPKQSAIGDGNKLDNSKKGVGWFWVFVAGYLFCHVLHKIIIPMALRFVPFANLATKIKSVFKIFIT